MTGGDGVPASVPGPEHAATPRGVTREVREEGSESEGVAAILRDPGE